MNNKQNNNRLTPILDSIQKIASLDFSSRLDLSAELDDIDAISSGLNMLSEELKHSITEKTKLFEKYNEFYNNSPDMLLSISPEGGIILECNQTLLKKTGYSREEVVDYPVVNLYHPDCHDDFKKAFKSFTEKGVVRNAELEIKKKDGSKIYVILNVEAKKDNEGNVVYSNSSWTDISEIVSLKNKLEKANLNLEQKVKDRTKDLSDYKFALDESCIVAITDLNGTITYANEKFCEISQYSRKELIGQNHRILNSGYHSQSFFKRLWTQIGAGKKITANIKNRAKDGSFYWVDTTIIPFIDNKGRPYQYVAIKKDITREKNVEQRIVQSIISSQEEALNIASEDLHEGVAQQLAGLSYHIQAIESSLKSSNDQGLKDGFSLIKKYVLESVETARSISQDLMPRALSSHGLVPAIKHYILKIKGTLNCEFEFNDCVNQNINKEYAITLYRTVESLLNLIIDAENLNKVIIDLDDDPSLVMNIQFLGNPNLFPENDIIEIQKRIELLGGYMKVGQNLDKNTTTVKIIIQS